MKKIDVVAAIIIHNHQILCMQRGKGKFDYISNKYEFPGGKIEAGESPTEALIREIEEEMEILIDEKMTTPYLTIEHQYPDFFIRMHSFLCPVDSRHFTLTEHIDYKWMSRNELNLLDWAPADIPIVERLMGDTDIES